MAHLACPEFMELPLRAGSASQGNSTLCSREWRTWPRTNKGSSAPHCSTTAWRLSNDLGRAKSHRRRRLASPQRDSTKKQSDHLVFPLRSIGALQRRPGGSPRPGPWRTLGPALTLLGRSLGVSRPEPWNVPQKRLKKYTLPPPGTLLPGPLTLWPRPATPGRRSARAELGWALFPEREAGRCRW